MKNSIKKLGIKVLFLVFLLVFTPTSYAICQPSDNTEQAVDNPNSAPPSVVDYEINKIPALTIEQTPSIWSKFTDSYDRFLNFIDVILEGFIVIEDSDTDGY